jgi:hypothetical protein
MFTQFHRHVGKTVIGLGNARFQSRRSSHDIFSVAHATEFQKYRGEKSVTGNALARARDGSLGQGQCLSDTPATHQSVCLAVDRCLVGHDLCAVSLYCRNRIRPE